MLWYTIFVAWGCLVRVQATEESPRIIIVGAGVSGISAASRLLQNGFNNITLLEAENRIGGRVYTREFGDYVVDVGGQWVHGQEGNEAYDLAWPLGLIEHSLPNPSSKFFSSSDSAVPEEAANSLLQLYFNISDSDIPKEYDDKSSGDYYESKFNEYFEAHPDVTQEQRTSLTSMFDLFDMGLNAADSWHNLSARADYITCAGDQSMTWKEKGYSTILDILMKKIPNPAEEVPVRNHTILNTEVSQINYNNPSGEVRVVTANGDEYTADHVIVTTSIGVLKADHKTIFNPQLSETKINTMKGLQLGSVVKLFLSYDKPWWPEDNGTFNSFYHFYWTEKDRTELAEDPEKSWLLGLSTVTGVANKPRLLLCWVTGPRARQMETIPEDRVFGHVKEVFHRFFGKTYNLTEPTTMLRSQWTSNKHFRGTWSYRNPEFVRSGMKITDLSDPIMNNGKPVVMFAGEVTHPIHFSTVQGAIGSGWREADRLKKVYDDRKSKVLAL